ncbi:hypothetical protein NKG94_16475 [Micromonospora sp. M12]
MATATATLAATALVATPATLPVTARAGTGVGLQRERPPGEQRAVLRRPAPWACPNILTKVSAPQHVYILCQKAGETVGGNPYWVYVRVNGVQGWMASYYTNNATNWIDGLGIC